MSITNLNGEGQAKREDSILMFNSNITSINEDGIITNEEDPIWTPIGEDNEEITRELNNEIESKKNVLGKNSIKHTAGADTTEVDPVAIRGNDVLSTVLYNIYKYKLTGDKATIQAMEVTIPDVQNDNVYGAFTEHAVIDLKSWGGDTSQLNAPITLNWKGDKKHGTFNTSTKKFNETTVIGGSE